MELKIHGGSKAAMSVFGHEAGGQGEHGARSSGKPATQTTTTGCCSVWRPRKKKRSAASPMELLMDSAIGWATPHKAAHLDGPTPAAPTSLLYTLALAIYAGPSNSFPCSALAGSRHEQCTQGARRNVRTRADCLGRHA